MKPTKKGCLNAAIVLGITLLLIYTPVLIQDQMIRNNRKKVQSLVSIGQQLDEAEQILVSSGYKLRFDEQRTPSIKEDYIQQLVIVGNPKPNPAEIFQYSTGLRWVPFTRSESPFVILKANLNGEITAIR